MDSRGKTMVADQFDFGFAVDWMRKDLAQVVKRQRNGARLPVTALVDQFYGDVQPNGRQALGHVQPDQTCWKDAPPASAAVSLRLGAFPHTPFTALAGFALLCRRSDLRLLPR